MRFRYVEICNQYPLCIIVKLCFLLLLCKLYACLYCFPCVTLVKLASVGVMPIKFLNLESVAISSVGHSNSIPISYG